LNQCWGVLEKVRCKTIPLFKLRKGPNDGGKKNSCFVIIKVFSG